MDLTNLSPAPWRAVNDPDAPGWHVATVSGYPVLLAEEDTESGHASVVFAAMARNAFDGDPAALAWWEANRRKNIEKETP